MAKPAAQRKRVRLGDVVEVPVPGAGLAYVQYANHHEVYGHLVRVLPGQFRSRPRSLDVLTAGPERWFAFIPLGAAVAQGYGSIVSNEPIPPHAQELPLFKICNANLSTGKKTWWLWDGKKTWQVGELEEKYYDCPMKQIIDLKVLEDRIATGWMPRDEVAPGPPRGLRPAEAPENQGNRQADAASNSDRKKAMKYPPLADFPTEEGWSMGHAQHEGRPMFVRVNTAAKPFRGHPELPYRLGVAVPLIEPNEQGLPGDNELSVLGAIEDALLAELQPSGHGFLVAVITTSGMREFVFYIRSPECATPALSAAAGCAAGHELQHYVEEDREWATYEDFIG